MKLSKRVPLTLGSTDNERPLVACFGTDSGGGDGDVDDGGDCGRAVLFNVIECKRLEMVAVAVVVVVLVADVVAGSTAVPLPRNGKSIFLNFPAGMRLIVFIWLNVLLLNTTKLPDRDNGFRAAGGGVGGGVDKPSPFICFMPFPKLLPFCSISIVSLPVKLK